MNEFSVFFLIVSIFASRAVCNINPSDLGLEPPPSPDNVKFGECFVVPVIAKGTLSTELYSYNHICPNFQKDRPEPPNDRKIWYFVGSFKGSETLSKDMPKHDYIPIGQLLIQFVYLKETEVRFLLKFTNMKFEITFQSLEQSQAFYGMVYRNVNLSKAAPNKIGMLHEILPSEYKEIDDNVEALCEKINGFWYTTFKNGRGAPLIIFTEETAFILPVRRSRNNKSQLLLLTYRSHYLLTFSSRGEARKFSEALLNYTKLLHLGHIVHSIRDRFEKNPFGIESEDE